MLLFDIVDLWVTGRVLFGGFERPCSLEHEPGRSVLFRVFVTVLCGSEDAIVLIRIFN